MKLLSSLVVCLTMTLVSVPAANIYWVSLHPADETPTSNAANAGFTNAPDAGYTKLLKAQGHNVTRYVTTGTPDAALLSQADLVIIGRSVPSGHYQNEPSPATWNGIAAPMMVMGGYVTRGSRLGLTTGDTIADVNSQDIRLRVNVPAHPLFQGVELDANRVMVNSFAQRVTHTNSTTGATARQNGISVNTSAVVPGSSVLAVVGTSGDAAVNGMIIGEFPQDVVSQRGSAFGAKRLAFFSGSRESGIHGDGAGIFDLLPDGEKLFLNAVNYLLEKSSAPGVVVTPMIVTNLYPGDALTLTANSWGSDPRTFQWYKETTPVDGATSPALSFTSLTEGDAGQYKLVVTNPYGSATSAVARVELATLPPASISRGMISYWPLNEVVGSKTPDLVSGYDMTLVNMGSTNLVDGRWGKAFLFDNAWQASLERVHNDGDALPIYQHPDFTVSFWVNGPIQSDHRVYAEGSTTNTNPMLSLGTHSSGGDGSVDIYIRNDTGATVGDHRRSTGMAYDGTWHNVVYVQRQVGDGLMKAQVWVDGVLDSVQVTPVRPLTANATAIGALRRASSSAWYSGMIDEVATWNRALTPDEVGILQVTSITNPPVRLQPLVINSFKTDLPAVAKGGSTTLRWDVSKDAMVSLTPFGDVTAQTSVGIGSRPITLDAAAQYVLTITRGSESLSSTTKVAVVEGIALGWALLDNFDQYSIGGSLLSKGYWSDTSGGSSTVVDVNGNPAARTGWGVTYLKLGSMGVMETQRRTLFFRFMAGADTAQGVTNIVGLTDKSQRSYEDNFVNVGPVLYAAAFTNDANGILTNAWYLGARNGWTGGNTSADITYAPVPLVPGAVYNVWIDVENKPLAEFGSDTFTVYLQKEGDSARTALFTDYTSDRDIQWADPVLGGAAPTLDKLLLSGNNATAVFDDFYLSTTGFNATVPRATGYTGVARRGTMALKKSGASLQVEFTSGVLQQATSLEGPWTDVPGNPTSPYTVTPGISGGMFFRTR